VIDIGATKTSVCCIDEGFIVEDSLIKKNYGGDDLTRLFFQILTKKNKNYFPSEYFNLENPYHFRIFEKLKEQECEFPSPQNPFLYVSKNMKFWLHKRNNPTKVFNVTSSDLMFLCPLSLFNPSIFETIKQINIPYLTPYNDIYCEVYNDSEDLMIDFQDGNIIK